MKTPAKCGGELSRDPELLKRVVIEPHDLRGLSRASDLWDEFQTLLSQAVYPVLGSSHHPMCIRLLDLAQEINLQSGRFLRRHWLDEARLAKARQAGERDILNER